MFAHKESGINLQSEFPEGILVDGVMTTILRLKIISILEIYIQPTIQEWKNIFRHERILKCFSRKLPQDMLH